ncbi:MAG TPA: peptide chain release factor-like protein, partial [Isosphaeraceae bacterium]|nr:peptide chain release factor-like protein [Isosphaeraceae bacterium]
MAMVHPARLDPDRLLKDCEIRFTRRSGPGGQNRNKVETAVVLTHRPSGTVAEASERRTQGENREAALFRLRMALALGFREEMEARPSELWRSRCRGGR